MSETICLEKPEVQTFDWRQTVLWPITEADMKRRVRRVDYETFMKFYQLCPVWAIRYKNRQVNSKWRSMERSNTCVMGEFSGWVGGWGVCKTCKEFGFHGSEQKPGFFRNGDYSWDKTIPAFVRHVEQYHPERLEAISR